MSPAELEDNEIEMSRCGGESRRVVDSGVEEVYVCLVYGREILFAKLQEDNADEDS